MNLLPKTEAAARVQGFQSWMREAAVDAVFILQENRYLTMVKSALP